MRWKEEVIEIHEADTGNWKYIKQGEQKAENGYNENIIEDMYVDEIKAFLAGIDNSRNYPNSIDKDINVLKLLKAIESSDGGF